MMSNTLEVLSWMYLPTFDGRLDPQFFLDWIQPFDKYFIWYDLTVPRKIKFVATKLTGQAVSTGPT